jgi:thiamine-monophosphate kinase
MLRRSKAHAGDDIYVSGTVGDGALGLLATQGTLTGLAARDKALLVARYRVPQPRVTLGPRLVDLATAALDVSDGVIADLGHICETSKLGAVVEEAALPLSAAARKALTRDPALIEKILTGGDDYEILFTAQAAAAPVLANLAETVKVPLTRIGRMEKGEGVRVQARDGTLRRLEKGGWAHF